MLGNTLYLSTVTLEIFTISFSKCAMKQIYFFFKPTTVWKDVIKFWQPVQKTVTDILKTPWTST